MDMVSKYGTDSRCNNTVVDHTEKSELNKGRTNTVMQH